MHRCCRSWQQKQELAFIGWLNMMLRAKYKERKQLESSQESMDGQTCLQCRQQLAQLYGRNETISSALQQVCTVLVNTLFP